MPLPNPKEDETKSEFVGRCVKMLNDNKDYDTNKQRIAVCYSQWGKSKKKAKSIMESVAEQLVIDKTKD